jgi:hypothetical protein
MGFSRPAYAGRFACSRWLAYWFSFRLRNVRSGRGRFLWRWFLFLLLLLRAARGECKRKTAN